MKRGEIRRVNDWDYVGHEATGNRPCLIISPDWFNSNGYAIIAPLTTPGPNHEHWWEIHIASTYSTCLVPDIRTVPTSALRSSVIGNATQHELDDVVFALHRLIGGSEDIPDPDCKRRDVWAANLAARPSASGSVTTELLILHYNPANLMAMITIVTRKPRRTSPIVFPLSSSMGITGQSVLLAQVRGISADQRLVNFVDTASQSDMAGITAQLIAFLS